MGKTLNTVASLAFALTMTDVALNKWRYAWQVFDILVSSAQAQEWSVRNITSPEHIDEKWSADNLFYTQGDIPVSSNVLLSLQQEFQTKFPDTQYTFFLMGENPSDFSYTNRDGQSLSGKEAVEFALSENLMNNTALGIGKKHIVLWISFKADNSGDRWARVLTSSAFDNAGIGEESSFASARWPLFQTVFPELKNGNIWAAIQNFVYGYEAKFSEIESRRIQEEQQKAQLLESAKRMHSEQIDALQTLEQTYESFLGKRAPRWWDNTIQELLSTAERYIQAEDWFQAGEVLQRAENAITLLYRSIESHDAIGDQINQLTTRLEGYKTLPYAESATDEYNIALEQLNTLRNQWEDKNISQYNITLEHTKNSIERYRAEIQEAQDAVERDARNQKIIKILGTGGSGLVVILAWVLALRKREKTKMRKEEFLKELSKWREAIRKTQEDLMDNIIPKSDIIVQLMSDATGVTKNEINTLSRDVWTVALIIAKLHSLLDKAEEIAGDGTFAEGPYVDALAILQQAEIHITPSLDASDDELLKVFGDENDMQTLSWYAENMSFTFESIVQEVDTRIPRIKQIFERLDKAKSEYQDVSLGIQGVYDNFIQDLETLAEVTQRETHILFPDISRFEENFQWITSWYEEKSREDIIWGYEWLEAVQQKLEAMRNTLVYISDIVVERNLAGWKNLLAAHDYNTDWLTQKVTTEFEALRDNAANIFIPDISIGSFENTLAENMSRIEKMYNTASQIIGSAERVEEVKKMIQILKTEIQTFKTKLSKSYNIDSSLLLQEESYTPETNFTTLENLLDAIIDPINNADTEKVHKILAEINTHLEHVRHTLLLTKKWFETYEWVKKHTDWEAQNILTRIETTQSELHDVTSKWAKSVLSLREWDASHEGSDRFIGNNISEIEKNQQTAQSLLLEASHLYEDGHVITAHNKLVQAQAYIDDSKAKMIEVSEQKKNIEETDTQNEAMVTKIQALTENIRSKQEASYVRPSTVNHIQKFLPKVDDILSKQQEASRDPFKIASSFSQLYMVLQDISGEIERDKKLRKDLEQGMEILDVQIENFRQAGHDAQFDSYPDSKKAKRIFREDIPRLTDTYNKLLSLVWEEQQDWKELLSQLHTLEKEVLTTYNALKGEERKTRNAYRKLEQAMDRVQDARNWSGSYGIYISSYNGSSLMNQAESAYSDGKFDDAIRFATQAYNRAENAIETAESEVRAEKRRIAREKEEARRRAEKKKREEAARQARMNDDDGWSSGGSSGFGWGGSFGGWSSGFGWGWSW